MFGKKDESKVQGRIDSLIGAGTRVEGNIRFSGGLRIDGEVKGNVEASEGASSSTLVLSEHARVEGIVSVLLVHGSVSRGIAPSFVDRLQRVAQDFAQQHQADQKLAAKDREGYTLLLAMRSWEFEAFARLRR